MNTYTLLALNCLILVLPVKADVIANLVPVAGTDSPLSVPFVDLDVTFSGEVTGLELTDFTVGGTAGGAAAHLAPVGASTVHYRLRVAGMNQPGNVTVVLPEGSANATAGGVNLISNQVDLNHVPHVLQDLSDLSDEFDDSESLAN